jgi:hypothetical protein
MFLRALILLLACMNIGVASWWLLHHEAQARPLPANEPGIATLTLYSESDRTAEPLAPAAAATITAPAVSVGAVCQSLGPFESAASLRKAMDALLPKVERIQFREVEAMAMHGYRVYLPAAADHAQALATARALSAKGVADYYVVTAGDQINTVSLGLFRELANASKRRDEVVALGYNAVVEPRTEPVKQWWIDLAAAPGFDWHAVLGAAPLKAEAAPCG